MPVLSPEVILKERLSDYSMQYIWKRIRFLESQLGDTQMLKIRKMYLSFLKLQKVKYFIILSGKIVLIKNYFDRAASNKLPCRNEKQLWVLQLSSMSESLQDSLYSWFHIYPEKISGWVVFLEYCSQLR